MKRKKKHWITSIVVFFLGILCVVPYFLVLTGGFYQQDRGFSFQAYYDVFLGTSQYLFRFWRSLGICLYIVFGQVLVSVLSGYGFAKYSFPGKNIMFFFLMILMILPLQVTQVPTYIILDKLKILGRDAALIFPNIFVPLGTFLMTQCFRTVSDDMLDSARIDGCGLFGIFFGVVIPVSKGGLVCTGILSFLDAWNMVEQPIAYLDGFEDYPISVALAYVSSGNWEKQFACCLLVLLPPLFLFSYFNRELVEGIVFGEEK
ncbi:MAG: carbohydrate ABC transporter permease [Lachnospiraceae bacterium]|nr:carbohydrate ABC transporter permease [Lachnospiraceae bacterium]